MSQWKRIHLPCRRYRRRRFDLWVGKTPGRGNGNPLQVSCLGNPFDRGAWWATAHGVAKSRTQLSKWALVPKILLYTLPEFQSWTLPILPIPSPYLPSPSFPGGLAGKNLPANAGDVGLVLGLGKKNGDPLQCPCLGNAVDRGARQAERLNKVQPPPAPTSTVVLSVPHVSNTVRVYLSLWLQSFSTMLFKSFVATNGRICFALMSH